MIHLTYLRPLHQDEMNLTNCLSAEPSALSPAQQIPTEKVDRGKHLWQCVQKWGLRMV